ncbi:MAG TPA: DUF6600 domain-containing protein [Thermoanaerobaculia bacterium]
MRPLRLACIALLLGVLTNCVAYGQPPGYSSPQPPQQSDPYGRGYDDDRYYGAPAPRVEVGFFYDELSPYGDWVRSRDYGWAWFPRDVHPAWRPYSDGRWVNTSYGWTWASYEPFGWATYHYGRWAWDPRFGWLWIPGTTWAPAWVSWQYGNGYIGWAPLPPTVGFSISVGLQLGGLDLRFGIRPDAYSFVPERSFLEPRLSGYYLPAARNVTIINNTTNITNYTYIDNRIINRGVEVQRIERATGKRVQAMRVAESTTKVRSEISSNEVRIYRPAKQKLDSVRGKERAEKEQKERASRAPATRERPQPTAERRAAPEVIVAPRVDRAPRVDTRKIEQQERREKQELDRYLADEKKKVERLHQQEKAEARAEAERSQIEKRHQAERQALQQEEREAAQQLAARQKAKREAALTAAPAKGKPLTAKEKAAAAKKEKDDKKKGKGQERKPEPPPPA